MISRMTAKVVFAIALAASTTSASSTTYAYKFRTGNFECDNKLACEKNPQGLPGLAGVFFEIDEELVPGGTLRNADLFWGASFSGDEPFAELPDWLVYDGIGLIPEYPLDSEFRLVTDANRRVDQLYVQRWTLAGGNPGDISLGYRKGYGGSVSWSFFCEDAAECMEYETWLSPIPFAAPVPLPPAALPFMAGLILLGLGGEALRKRRGSRGRP